MLPRWRGDHTVPVSDVDISLGTFVVGDPDRLAQVVAVPGRWRRWWPDLELEVYRDRGAKGVQWRVTGALLGTAELWLEPVRDGVVLHWFLRADRPDSRGRSRRDLVRDQRNRVRDWTAAAWALKDECESDRAPGQPLQADLKSVRRDVE